MPLSEEEIMQLIRSLVIQLLRNDGMVRFGPEDIMEPELEAAVKGQG